MTEKDEKKRALDLALSQIEKQYGKGAIMKLGGADAPGDFPAISTGSRGLDIALGVGGLPRGRVIEIFGPESSGKTTLTLSVIANAQKMGGQAAFIDAEHAVAQYLSEYESHFTATITIGMRYAIYFGIFSVLFYFDNKNRYKQMKSNLIRKELVSMISSFGIGEIIFLVIRWPSLYYFLEVGIEPYIASLV